jgi:hypothetical protein
MPQVSRNHTLFFFALVLAVVLSFVGLAGAQVAPGTPSFVPQDCHEVDCVDLMNNNIPLNVPIRSKAGAIPFNVSLNGSYYISLTAPTRPMVNNITRTAERIRFTVCSLR